MSSLLTLSCPHCNPTPTVKSVITHGEDQITEIKTTYINILSTLLRTLCLKNQFPIDWMNLQTNNNSSSKSSNIVSDVMFVSYKHIDQIIIYIPSQCVQKLLLYSKIKWTINLRWCRWRSGSHGCFYIRNSKSTIDGPSLPKAAFKDTYCWQIIARPAN